VLVVSGNHHKLQGHAREIRARGGDILTEPFVSEELLAQVTQLLPSSDGR
jgi:hypothetical protein